MQDQTTWFKVTLWGRQAETASQYLTKGRPVYIEGRLRVEEWTDRDGKPRHTLEVHATDMQFIAAEDPKSRLPRKLPPREWDCGTTAGFIRRRYSLLRARQA